MSHRPRPLLSVRLTGPAGVVAAQKVDLISHLTAAFGDNATCRISTRRADYANEIRLYITISAKEVPPR